MSARALALTSLLTLSAACGAGVPVQLRIDEITLELDMDEVMAVAAAGMRSLFPGDTVPELWPDSLPDVEYTLHYPTPPVPVDLTPEPGSEEATKYADINKVNEAVERIEINELVLRVEQSNLSIPIPELALQVADRPDVDPDDRAAWFTIGRFPGQPVPHFIGDISLGWAVGGESLLNFQLGDDTKELALRALADIDIDTDENPAMPRGLAVLRLIVVATFFVQPAAAL